MTTTKRKRCSPEVSLAGCVAVALGLTRRRTPTKMPRSSGPEPGHHSELKRHLRRRTRCVLIDSKEGSRKKRSPHAKGAKRLAERPSIRNVQPEHLDDTEALFELHRQAVGIGLACDSPAGQLDFLSMVLTAL